MEEKEEELVDLEPVELDAKIQACREIARAKYDYIYNKPKTKMKQYSIEDMERIIDERT